MSDHGDAPIRQGDDCGHQSEDADASLADITERLFERFEGRLPLTTIARVVRRCRRELDIAHGPMLPEMLERLAHQRLSQLAEQAPDDVPDDPAGDQSR